MRKSGYLFVFTAGAGGGAAFDGAADASFGNCNKAPPGGVDAGAVPDGADEAG